MSYITVPNITNLVPGTSDFAIEFRITRDSGSSTYYIFDKYCASPSYASYRVGLKTGVYLYFSVGSFAAPKTFQATDALSGSDNYVVINVDRSGNAVGYINGAAAAGATVDISADVATNINCPSNITIGEFYGTMRQIRYYNRILTAADIAYNYSNANKIYDPTNLQLWLKCDEGRGKMIHDSSPNLNHVYMAQSSVDPEWDSMSTGGIYICLDKSGAVWKREDTNLYHGSSLCEWDNLMVVGNGATGGTKPNFVYFDKTVPTEQSSIAAGALVTASLTSVYEFPVFGAESDERKELTRITLVYEDKIEYNSTGFIIYYRIDDGTWTQLIEVADGTTPDLEHNGETYVYNLDTGNIRDSGKLWSFKLETTGNFKIIGFTPHLRSHPKTQK